MMRSVWRKLNGEDGVAMITVLFVGAALTVVASTAAFMTVRELQAGGDDRRASEAVAVAEAGIDRFIEMIRSGEVHWGQLRLAGCDVDHPAVKVRGSLDDAALRTFDVSFTTYNPYGSSSAERQAPAACTASESNPRHPSPKVEQYFAITSTGRAPSATRVVRQVILIGTVGLPIGVYADGLDMNGTPEFNGISFLSRFDVEGREKMGFSGIDPYYALSDFWPGQSSTIHMPASVQSLGKIYLKKVNQENSVEHPPELNCTANKPGSAIGQSQWDQSASGGALSGPCQSPNAWQQVTSSGGEEVPPGPSTGSFPPTSKMTAEVFEKAVPQPALSDQDYLALRANAKQKGLYCFIPATGNKDCWRAGTAWTAINNSTKTISVTPTDVSTVINAGATTFVAYFEYEDPSQAMGTNNVIFNQGANVWPCSDDLEQHRSMVLVVRNGSYGLGTGNVSLNGLMVVPEGEVRLRGGHLFQGTILAKKINLQGNAGFINIPCWVRNMPGPFLSLTPTRWSEVDRP